MVVIVIIVVAAVCAAAYFAVDSSNHEANCETFKQAAQVDLRAGRLADAQVKFENAVKEAEHSKNAMQLPMVLYGLAGVYGKVNQNSKARDCLVRAIEQYEKLYACDSQTVDRGTRLLLLRKLVEAEIALARIQKTENHLPEARKTYESAIKHEKEDPHQIESLALIREYVAILYQMGETKLATKIEIESESNFATSGDFFKFTQQGTDAMLNTTHNDSEKWFRIAYLIAKNHHDMDRAASTLSHIAICKILDKKYADAETVLQQALSIKLQNSKHVTWITVKNLQLLAFVSYLQGKNEDGDRLCAQARELDPTLGTSPEALAVVRDYYNIFGEKRDRAVLYKMIIGWHEPIAKSHPSKEAYALLVDEYGSAGMDQKCIDALKQMNRVMGKGENEIDHLNIFQCSTVAQAYGRIGNYKEEIRFWTRARQLLPSAPHLKFMISRALAYSLLNSKEPGHEQEIIALFGDVWRSVDKGNYNSSELEGDIARLEGLYARIGRPRSRIELLKDAHSLAILKWKNPALSLWVCRELAHAYQGDLECKKAIGAYNSLIAEAVKQGASPDVLDAETRLVWCLQLDGQLSEATKLANKVIATDCKKEYWSTRLKSHCFYNLGVINQKEGKRELALKTFEEGRKMGPDIESSLDWAAMSAFALSLANQHEVAEAVCLTHLDHAKKQLTKPSARVAILMNTLADTYTADKKFSEADVYYKKSLEEFEKLQGPEVRRLEANCRNHYRLSLNQRKQKN